MEIYVHVFYSFHFPADTGEYHGDYHPDWGSMNFLVNFLRPTPAEGASWYSLLKKAGGGCNDLLYSGHMLVAVLTAMAWTVILYINFETVLSHHPMAIALKFELKFFGI